MQKSSDVVRLSKPGIPAVESLGETGGGTNEISRCATRGVKKCGYANKPEGFRLRLPLGSVSYRGTTHAGAVEWFFNEIPSNGVRRSVLAIHGLHGLLYSVFPAPESRSERD